MAGRKPTVSDREILGYFRETEDPILTTSEVADLAEFSTTTGANKRLTNLMDEGYLDRKNAGNGYAWWITPEGEDFLEEAEE